MQLTVSAPFSPDAGAQAFLSVLPPAPAVFALFPEGAGPTLHPYLSRTRDLRRRLNRLLSEPSAQTKRLNLRAVTRRIEYQEVGSNFEAQWLLYSLNKLYYARTYRQRLRLKPPALLKVNLRNRFPRCYPTRRICNDGSLYYGPFPSKVAAERFASEFLDLFKIRRCVEDLNPDPAHPGCIYSQMRMCLAPCFAGCTDEAYQQELAGVVEFLDLNGQNLTRSLEEARAQASESLEFEQAARLHSRLEKLHEVLRSRPSLVRRLDELHAIIVQPGAQPGSLAFFRATGSMLRGPATLILDENVASPVPLDQRLQSALDSLGREDGVDSTNLPKTPPAWEPLALLARWYYSSFREGELITLAPNQEIPHARLIRTCRKVLQSSLPTR